jgi:hypothetical protein
MLATIQALEARISALEAAQGQVVSGWEEAGRVVGLSVKTIKRRIKADPSFPQPTRINHFTKQDRFHTRPEWRRTDLIKYRHNV